MLHSDESRNVTTILHPMDQIIHCVYHQHADCFALVILKTPWMGETLHCQAAVSYCLLVMLVIWAI